MLADAADTIVAIATPPGHGGIGVVRLSGTLAHTIAEKLCQCRPAIRHATYVRLRDTQHQPIDEGLLILFQGPHSFTGEDIAELQTHGSPMVLDALVQNACQYGARLARPGEFSERAFLNGKLDLAQAEAIADLIHASTEKSARAALASLHGEFSQRIHSLSDAINHLRLYVEAAIDFPEEEIDFLGDSHIGHSLNTLIEQLDALRRSTHHGCLLRDGMTVVIIGRPNVGKSSLLNALAGYEAAIVTDQPGTTRDLMRERIQIDGIPIHLTDSAGLRQSNDAIEQEGIRRAWDTVERSQRVLLVTDDQIGMGEEELAILAKIPPEIPVIVIHNKVDLTHTPVGKQTETLAEGRTLTHLYLSARSGAGIELIHAALKTSLGVADQEGSGFLARRRHLVALDQATKAIQAAAGHFNHNLAGELIAEELRQARQALNAITGEFTTEDLLDQIFREFCVGK